MSSHKFKVTRLERRLGRYELISWINSFLRIDYTKVEEFSDGIAYCQVLDAMIPDSVPLHKLTFHPRSREEKTRNLKILDRVLAREKLTKALDVNALAGGNFQENNEMLQWCCAMVQRNCPHVVTTYKALEKRVAAMKKQRYASSAPSVSRSLKALTNRLIPSEVGMSLLFGDSPDREASDLDGDVGNEVDGDGVADGEHESDREAGAAIREAELALLRPKITPGSRADPFQGSQTSDASPQYHDVENGYFWPRALQRSFDRAESARGADGSARPGDGTPDEGGGGGESAQERRKIDDVLLEIEETLVLRLKAFDKLREKVAIEHARKEFFFNKLASVEQLCELMPYSAMSDTCKGILTMESQSQAQQKEDVAPKQVN